MYIVLEKMEDLIMLYIIKKNNHYKSKTNFYSFELSNNNIIARYYYFGINMKIYTNLKLKSINISSNFSED